MSDRVPAGPVDLAVLTFDEPWPPPAFAAAAAAPVAAGAALLLDALVVSKDGDDEVRVIDVDEETDTLELVGFPAALPGLISAADVDEIADSLRPGSSAVVLAWENTWATALASTVHAMGGSVDLHVRVELGPPGAGSRPAADTEL